MISVISSLFDSTTGENTTTGCVNRLFVTFCDMSQKAFDTTGSGPRSCGVLQLSGGLYPEDEFHGTKNHDTIPSENG